MKWKFITESFYHMKVCQNYGKLRVLKSFNANFAARKLPHQSITYDVTGSSWQVQEQ